MEEDRGARQAINLDHERRLMRLEAQFVDHGRRVTALEHEMNTLTPQVDEMLLARRVSAGVTAELRKGRTADAAAGLSRWTKLGIAAAIATSVGSFILAIIQAAA